ncbi:MAG: hypothetical protein ACHBN1_29280 [Heteroscytonema crispum UTEX LB 1556]
MWVRFTFWLVLLVWIADILQPGYLQFYRWRNLKVLAQSLAIQKAVVSIPTSTPAATEKKTPTIPNSKSQVTPDNQECRKPKNNFEEILSSTNVGCWQASPATRRR